MQSFRRGRARASELVDDAAPLVDRGREAAESLAREAAEHVPSRARHRRRRRGVIAVLLLAIAGGVAVYLASQRRGKEPARLSFDSPGPDVAPPPAPEPPSPPTTDETYSESVAAVAAVASAGEASEGEQERASEVVPAVEPVTSNVELELPSAVAPMPESLLDVAADEPIPEFDELVEADEADEYPVAELDEEPVAEAVEPEVEAPVIEEPTPEAAPLARRESRWFAPAVSETAQPEPPEPAPEVDRSAPLHSPLRGATSLPPSGPAGAPFRPAGDGLPGGRSWPTLPN